MSSMNAASARSSRASCALQHHEARARQLRRRLEVHQAQRLADLEVLLGLVGPGELRRLADPADLLVVLLVRARPARRRPAGWGSSASASCSFLSASRCSSSPLANSSLSAATSAISACAFASSLAALALPISLDAALRRACASCSCVTTLRRASSSAISLRRQRLEPALLDPGVERRRIVAYRLDVEHDRWPLAPTSSPRRRGPRSPGRIGSLGGLAAAPSR